MVEAKRVVRRKYGVAKTNRPYYQDEYESGAVRMHWLPMPELSEIIAKLPDEAMQRLVVQTYARGLSCGYRQGLDKRDELLGQLTAMGIPVTTLRTAVGSWSPAYMRRVLLSQGLNTAKLKRIQALQRARARSMGYDIYQR